ISCDLPIEHPLLKTIVLLELGFYLFLYPLKQPEFLPIQKSISDYLDIKDIERYSGTNPLGLYIGLHYFYHLYKIILMNGVSDVEYLRSLFGSLKSCIGLIQNIKDLFILLFEIKRDQILKDLDKYLDSFGKLKDIESIEYKKY